MPKRRPLTPVESSRETTASLLAKSAPKGVALGKVRRKWSALVCAI